MVDQNDLHNARSVVEEGSVALVVGWRRRGSDFELRKIEVATEVAETFRDSGLVFIDDLLERTLVNFTVGYQPSSYEAMEFEGPTEGVGGLYDELANPVGIDGFDPDERAIGKISFYSVGFHAEQQAAILLRRAKPVRPLQPNRFAVLFRENRITRVGDPILTFDTDFDILLYEAWGVTTSAADLQALFRDLAALREAIDGDVESIHGRFPLANLDEFLEACRSDPRMMTKLHTVASKPYLDEVAIDDIRDVIDRYQLPQDLLDPEGRFVYDSRPERRWLILKILDDDYLESRVTERLYEVNSKAPRS